MAYRWIGLEAGALERRLSAVPRFSATIPMVRNAIPGGAALRLADGTVARSQRVLRRQLRAFRRGLFGPARDLQGLGVAHRRLVTLRHRFDALLGTVDIFADALTQRAEHGSGVLLRGLDAIALDGLGTRGNLFRPPPLCCYFDRGRGGAVRRAFTRLPGGERNAIALVRIPRERLSGVGLASLLHEAAHQGIASLELTAPYREALNAGVRAGNLEPEAGRWWVTKVTEVLPDAWACAKLGVSATLGLFGVLATLPPFVFHDEPDDPHPMPHVRALFSAAFGDACMPHPVWRRLSEVWRALYPLDRLPSQRRAAIERLERSVPACARVLADARPTALRSMTLFQAVGSPAVHPARLLPQLDDLVEKIRSGTDELTPCMALAAVGLARHEGRIASGEEHDLLTAALRRWASPGRGTEREES